MLCAVVGFISDSAYGAFIAGTALGVLSMLLALHVASRRPQFTGGVPGLIGGMIAAAVGMGWRHLSSWSGLVGGIFAICAWVTIDREVLGPNGSPATE